MQSIALEVVHTIKFFLFFIFISSEESKTKYDNETKKECLYVVFFASLLIHRISHRLDFTFHFTSFLSLKIKREKFSYKTPLKWKQQNEETTTHLMLTAHTPFICSLFFIHNFTVASRCHCARHLHIEQHKVQRKTLKGWPWK